MTVYLDHRLEVTRRRTQFLLTKATDRLHLVEGLLIAIVDIDDVIAIIRSSDDAAAARARLIEVFELTEIQANYILDMQLRRLTRFSTIELEAERDRLRDEIAGLQQILDDDEQLRTLVGNELAEVAKTHGTPRRTILLAASGVAATGRDDCAARGRRRPVLGAAVLGRTARPDRQPTTRCRAAGRAPTTTCSSPGCAATARGEIGLLTSTGRLVKTQRARPADGARPRPTHPNLQGGTHLSELRHPGARRTCAVPRPPWHRTRSGSRSAPRRASSSG